ncbi:polyphosphate kinase [Paenibacillus darwinianus]|uniref:Polyphosphate kinase n=1 Tax=Paenibacillus darwinianus TaxID=1380763 RepID=A0A9W5S1T5_9BACL|nr:polyphosphate kinase 1 [Paenibacillus darwinianus]EXX89390.1 polyphosphate kinase [Paenibacillus darwinianus]EXX91602.1 polyphosphate kinase [Paenibacillus darwinianus]EXX92463.1 polyphosphate kinase [Paenibacillus darwinianus]
MRELSQYLNRDLSWIEFNRRVLAEAQDPDTPLLERAKFLAIVSSNLDEFMSVRVAGIQDQIKAGFKKVDFTGYTPAGLWKRIMKRTSEMVAEQYKTYRDVMRGLSKEGIVLRSIEELSAAQEKALQEYNAEIVFPVLTPMAFDQSRPFPLVHTRELYMAVLLRREGDPAMEEPYFAIVQVPSILPRFVEVPGRKNSKKLEIILLEELIEKHIDMLFNGYEAISVSPFRLTRNADLTLNEEGAEDLLEEIEKELRKRRRGLPVRLEIAKGMDPYALAVLQEELEIGENIIQIDGPLDLSSLMKFASSLPGRENLGYSPIVPVYPFEFEETEDMFEVLRGRDVLVHHPYESFDAVNDFLLQAAEDPDVLAIKMTLYRVSGESTLVQALANAAEAGKQVTVVVELKARFDEERNIAWARQLEKGGCHVVYGLVGLKTHAKILLVVRRETNRLRRYVHVGTGNYNGNTAKVYTDVGLFTSHPVIGADASALFNEVTGYSSPYEWKAIAVAPSGLRDRLFELIDREKEHALAGRPAHIIAKMNSLSHQDMIDKLYEASQAGVKIELIVRGVCSLRPGVPGRSDNIRVISVVDRYLEHSRLLYVRNGGDEEAFISSADWMTRNLTRRIELMCPVFDPNLKRSVINILRSNLRDNVKARELQPNGSYARVRNEQPPFRSQFESQDITTWKEPV